MEGSAEAPAPPAKPPGVELAAVSSREVVPDPELDPDGLADMAAALYGLHSLTQNFTTIKFFTKFSNFHFFKIFRQAIVFFSASLCFVRRNVAWNPALSLFIMVFLLQKDRSLRLIFSSFPYVRVTNQICISIG